MTSTLRTRPEISIVTLTYRKAMLLALRANAEATIGASYEWVQLENAHGGFRSIAAAYNEGVRRATGEFVAFVHEDVAFHSTGWGARAITHFQADPRLGLLGVIGSKFKSWQATSHTHRIRNDRYKAGRVNAGWKGFTHPDPKPAEEAVCVDGLFLFMRRSDFTALAFDERLVQGFHGYDMDICLQVHFSGRKVAVAHDIELSHFSPGKQDRTWRETNKAISRKWSRYLPTASGDLRLNRWQLLALEWSTIAWLAGPHPIKRLVKIPLGFMRYLLRPRGPAYAPIPSVLTGNPACTDMTTDDHART